MRCLLVQVRNGFVGQSAWPFQTTPPMTEIQSQMAPVASDSPTAAFEPSLDRLLRRLGESRDFPAFSAAIQQLNRLSRSGDESLGALAEVVLQDVGLTHKILRAVNSTYYRRSQAVPVTTMSRAIQLIGFDALRDLALSLLHLERMRDAAHADVLLRRFIEICVASEFAREIAGHVAVPAEQAGICAALQDLGWLVVLHNLPDEAQRIEEAMQGGTVDLVEASRRELGVDVGELGVRLARQWGFAEAVLDGMVPLDVDRPVRAPRTHEQWLRTSASAARDAARLLLTSSGRTPEQALATLVARYGRSLGLSLEPLCAAARRAILRVCQLCGALDLTVDRALVDRLVELGLPLDEAERTLSYDLKGASPSRPVGEFSAGCTGGSVAGRRDADTRIGAGLTDLDTARAQGRGLGEVIQIAMLTMLESLALQRVVLCMRDTRRGRLTGRLGIGLRAADLAPAIDIALDRSADVFSAACMRGTDLLISDAQAPSLRARLPGWFLDPAFDARSFLLLPLPGPTGPIGLLYGDHARAGGICLDDAQLGLLRRLRNRLLEAIRERG